MPVGSLLGTTLARSFAAAHARRTQLRAIAGSAAFIAGSIGPALAATYYVDAANPSAQESGPGTQAAPYRTIQAAVAARGVAGNTILVGPAIYREAVTIAAAGTPSSRITLQATSPGVRVSGADDLSSAALWSPVAGSIYVAASVTWAPSQVFIDGARLAVSAATPALLPPRTFRYVSGAGLYVNAGGANPGLYRCEASRRSNAFVVSGACVTIDGFEISQTGDRAVAVTGGANGATVQNCTIAFANKYGIEVGGATGVTIAHNVIRDNNDHGIFVGSAGTGARVLDNECFRNARPAVRAANGIDIDGSAECVVEGNRCHHNQDSGIQFYNGANNGISRNNVSWNNGDHGYDHVRSTGVRNVHNVAYGNYKDGFSFEGFAGGGSLYDCISVDNGLTTNEFDVWVDAASAVGFHSDYNLIWNTTSQSPFKYVATIYGSLSAYAAGSGQDAHSQQLDPRFVRPALGDFHLLADSPAIDAAKTDVAAWPAADAEGAGRVDDPDVANTGTGSPTYADVGACEFVPAAVGSADRAPVVLVQDVKGTVEGSPIRISVTAGDPDGDAIVSLTADLSSLPPGNDAVFTTNATRTLGTLTWTPTSNDGRSAPYAVSFTATNALSSTATTALTVTDGGGGDALNLCGNPGFETDRTGWDPNGSSGLARVAPGHSGGFCIDVRSTLPGTFGITDAPSWVPAVAAPGITYRITAWVRSAASRGTARVKVREFVGADRQGASAYSTGVALAPGWQLVTFDYVTRVAGSYLDIEINDYPLAAGESFQVDDITITKLPPMPAAMPAASQRALEAHRGFDARLLAVPVRGEVVLDFSITRPGGVRIAFYDVTGRAVGTVFEGTFAAGDHRANFATRDIAGRLPAGAYYYRLHAPEGVKTGRFVVLE